MKFLLATVTALVVFTADGRHFRDEPGLQVDTTVEAQLFTNWTEGQGGQHFSLNGPKQDHQLKKKTKQYGRKSQKRECKRSDVCGVMGGICVTNATLCGGRLVPEGCKGNNCQCCVSGTIEAKFDKIEKSLNDSLNSQLQRLKESMEIELQSIVDTLVPEFHSLHLNLNTSLFQLNSKIDSLPTICDHTTLESTTVSEPSQTSVEISTILPPTSPDHTTRESTTVSESSQTSVQSTTVLPSISPGDLIFPTSTTPKLTWRASVQRCEDMGAQPFVPRTSQDWLLYSRTRGELEYWMWLPASDEEEEGTLKWTNGEGVPIGHPGLVWRDGEYMQWNTGSSDCVLYGFDRYGVFMFPCDGKVAYPMICSKSNP